MHRSHLSVFGAMVFALLLLGMQFAPTSSLAPKALASSVPKPALQKATFTLDGVAVNIATPFLPGPFVTSKLGEATQVASAATVGVHAHIR